MTANLPLPGPVTAKPEQVAKDIFKAYQAKKDQLYTLWMWRYLMFIIRNIPEPIFKRLNL
jgi:short-subunit dehydrogenase